jgi:hypothetical protein
MKNRITLLEDALFEYVERYGLTSKARFALTYRAGSNVQKPPHANDDASPKAS